MGYTMSLEASIKVQRSQVRGLLHHNGRDVDKAQGKEVKHSNSDINADLTDANETLVSDGKGGWKPCEDLDEVATALDARLKTVKKPLRKDAVVLRPLILQLDPEWYADHQSDEEREAAAGHMLDWAIDTFGAENIVYASLHNDENAPHLHVGFCPVTEDGRLAQKDWFSSPVALREMHQDLRQHMTDAGYDIEMRNKKPGKYAKRMSVQEYKDFQDLQAEAQKIKGQEAQLSRWAERLRDQETEQREQEKALEDREKALRDREQEAQRREQEIQERETVLEARRTALEARETALPGLAAQAAKGAVQREIEAARAANRPLNLKAAQDDGAKQVLAALGKYKTVEENREKMQRGQDFSL